MSCPVKYREIGDFHKYYSGAAKAPYLTIFVGGNHEASSHLWELFYGGWVAPNIYYMGAANVVRLGGVRIAGMSGIWKGRDFNKHHYERLPYSYDDVKTIYHVREIDTRKLLLLKSQVDIGISHDWPRAIENHGNSKTLWKIKPHFEEESKDGTLGNQAATYVMDRLRPPYWFAAHMHCKFAATKIYEDSANPKGTSLSFSNGIPKAPVVKKSAEVPVTAATTHNADEIDLDMDDEEMPPPAKPVAENGSPSRANKDEINLDDDGDVSTTAPTPSAVPSDLRAQLPAAFSAPRPRQTPGQPTPLEVTNKTVRFLALDKCLPGRKFLQLLEVHPHTKSEASLPQPTSRSKPKFEYDPEWLAITRVFAPNIILGNKYAPPATNLGEGVYRPRIEAEQAWVHEHIVNADKLEIPENFVITAPIFQLGMPEFVNESPVEYNNPQMQQFCDLVGIENKFYASEDEKNERMRKGPEPVDERPHGGFGRGGGRGRGDRGGGRGGGRGRGRGWGSRRGAR
jgi:lariat debranching enzyme